MTFVWPSKLSLKPKKEEQSAICEPEPFFIGQNHTLPNCLQTAGYKHSSLLDSSMTNLSGICQEAEAYF